MPQAPAGQPLRAGRRVKLFARLPQGRNLKSPGFTPGDLRKYGVPGGSSPVGADARQTSAPPCKAYLSQRQAAQVMPW